MPLFFFARLAAGNAAATGRFSPLPFFAGLPFFGDPLRLALLASSPSGGAKSYGLCVLCVGFKRGRRWSGLDDARRKAEAFPEGVDDLVLFIETDDER